MFLAASATLLGACGSEPALPDASVDAPRFPDGNEWACDPHPPDLPAPSSLQPQVVFDTPIPLVPGTDSGAVTTFFDGSDIIVVTPRELHFVDQDGVLQRSVQLSLGDVAGEVIVKEIAMGIGGFGAVVKADGMNRFCEVDPLTGLDESRCTELSGSIAGLQQVVVDGAGYSVFGFANDDTLYRWRFDGDGALVDQTAMWVEPTRYIGNAGVGDAGTMVVSGTNIHWLDGTGDTIEPLAFPVGLVGTNGANVWSGDSSDAIANLRHLRCSVAPDSAMMPALIRFDLDAGTWTTALLALRANLAITPILDGDGSAVPYLREAQEILISRFDSTGHATVSAMHVPLSYEQSGSELHFIGAGRAIGPGDYVFVYDGTGVGGRRVARIQVP